MLEVESSQRGFLLTDQATYLDSYRAGIERIPVQIEAVRSLTADNPAQQYNVRLLEPVISTKLQFMAETVAKEQSGDHEGARSLIASGRGKQAMEAIQMRLKLMEHEESRLLTQRELRLAASSRFSSWVLFGLVTLNAVFAIGMLMLWHRLSRIQGLVRVCAWSRTVEYEGRWLSFEEYLKERFHLDTSHGISPAEAEKAFGAVAQKR